MATTRVRSATPGDEQSAIACARRCPIRWLEEVVGRRAVSSVTPLDRRMARLNEMVDHRAAQCNRVVPLGPILPLTLTTVRARHVLPIERWINQRLGSYGGVL